MNLDIISQGNESTLMLSGELTLIHAAEFKTQLVRALVSARRIVIDTQGLSEVDMACLQLICSAHQSAAAAGKELSIASRQSEAFARKVEQAGLRAGVLCGREMNGKCLWNGGDNG